MKKQKVEKKKMKNKNKMKTKINMIMKMKMMMKQWIKTKKNKIIKGKNNILDEIIDKSKSFEDQIKLKKKREDLKGFWPYSDCGDKELKSKYFKIKLQKCQMRLTKSYLNKYFVIHF